MAWKKIGRIFVPSGSGWMRTHAQNPLPEPLGGGYFRVHFAARDDRNRARGGSFVFHIERPTDLTEISETPTIGLGSLGAFDDAGVMPSSIVPVGGARFMFYTGWSRTIDVSFAFHIGLAISDNDGAFTRVSKAPVLGRNHYDPYVTGAPYVLLENGVFRMWYASCTEWIPEREGEKPRHYYTVKYAESSDGRNWQSSDQLCLSYAQDEYAIARPVVWKTHNGYQMWFTFRGGANTYRVGVAESTDGVHWNRLNKALGIDVTPGDWDSEMVCYAHPIFYDGRVYALYNGNGYGVTGIGLAVLE